MPGACLPRRFTHRGPHSAAGRLLVRVHDLSGAPAAVLAAQVRRHPCAEAMPGVRALEGRGPWLPDSRIRRSPSPIGFSHFSERLISGQGARPEYERESRPRTISLSGARTSRCRGGPRRDAAMAWSRGIDGSVVAWRFVAFRWTAKQPPRGAMCVSRRARFTCGPRRRLRCLRTSGRSRRRRGR